MLSVAQAISGSSMKSSISMSGPTWWLEMKASTSRPERRSTCVDELVLHRVLEGAAGFLHDRRALQLDHRLLDVGVDAAEHAGEQIVAEQQRLGGDGRAVVVALVQRDHRSRSRRRAARRRSAEVSGAGMAACSLVLRIGVAREAEGREPDERSQPHDSARWLDSAITSRASAKARTR